MAVFVDHSHVAVGDEEQDPFAGREIIDDDAHVVHPFDRSQDDNRHAPANTPGIRHVAFAVEDIDAVVADLRARGVELVGELERYEDSYRLCYVRGTEGIIVELAEQIS